MRHAQIKQEMLVGACSQTEFPVFICIRRSRDTEQAYYNYVFNYIVLNEDEDALNSTGFGWTYFHEVGHLIDDYVADFGVVSNDKSMILLEL